MTILLASVAACLLAGGRWGKRGLTITKRKHVFLIFLVSVAACPLAGGRWGKMDVKIIIKTQLFLNLFGFCRSLLLQVGWGKGSPGAGWQSLWGGGQLAR